MKPIILLLSLTTISLAGDLKLSCDVEPAWIPRAVNSEYLPSDQIKYLATNNAFALTIKPQLDWKFLYGWIEFSGFSASSKSDIGFVPFRISYSNEIGVRYNFSSATLSAGWMHNCQHKILIAEYYDSRKVWNDVGYDYVFIRFHFSTQ